MREKNKGKIEEFIEELEELKNDKTIDDEMREETLVLQTMLKELLNDPLKLMVKFQKDRMLDKQPYQWSNESVNVVEELFEALGYDVPKSKREKLKEKFVKFVKDTAVEFELEQKEVTPEDIIDAFADICELGVGAIMKMRYCPKCVLLEMAKHINSRTGKIVDGKFQKDQNVKTYEPVYGKCVLKADDYKEKHGE